MSGLTDKDIEAVTDTSQLSIAYGKLFDSCDNLTTGMVRTMDLVKIVKKEMLQGAFEKMSERQLKIHFDDLTSRLDEKLDDGYVDKPTFIKEGVEWMLEVGVRKILSLLYLVFTHIFFYLENFSLL